MSIATNNINWSHNIRLCTVGQRGTLWWLAHIFWLRATVYGAIVILPKKGPGFPFPQPYKEANIVLGEWWNNDVEEVVKQGNKLGPPNMHTPSMMGSQARASLSLCSETTFVLWQCHLEMQNETAFSSFLVFAISDTYALEVEQGKMYLLRIINAALNDELFFAIAGHNLTVVEIDVVYTKPFTSQAILIVPGQTTNVLVQAKHSARQIFHGS
ncbi:laccase-11-like [Prunus yedoensis var. nudiflora]|uniref:Laccase-11-like n=1 Tax=Prunus yedoensis var. nudiflora TaxID=2094558 RepID=A0A314US88_PRUYE|nr:laccase-11-like [Prunus yedoensis var. nudiflora]